MQSNLRILVLSWLFRYLLTVTFTENSLPKLCVPEHVDSKQTCIRVALLPAYRKITAGSLRLSAVCSSRKMLTVRCESEAPCCSQGVSPATFHHLPAPGTRLEQGCPDSAQGQAHCYLLSILMRRVVWYAESG